MRTDILLRDTPMADDQYVPDVHRHPLSIDEIAAAGWGASWQPDVAQATASAAWDFWPIRERFST